MKPAWIQPDWPVAANVRALSTTRIGGVSAAPYDSLNLGSHVGDEPGAVAENRRLLQTAAGLPAEPLWLTQVHGTRVVDAINLQAVGTEADAAVAHAAGQVCAIMTADCLPVLLASRHGDCVAAAHAGWRGLAAGILPATLAAMSVAPAQVVAWLGPAIGPQAFEVGAEVRAAFIEQDPGARSCFTPHNDRWLADLYGLARRQLQNLGITHISGGGFCTHSDPARFFSYRRDGACGRMASLIWLTEPWLGAGDG